MRLILRVSTIALAAAAPGVALAQEGGPVTTTPSTAAPPQAPPPAAGSADPFATPPAIADDAVATPAAAGPTPVPVAERDPLEKFNRGVWGFNQGVDRVLLKPAAKVYRFVTPRPVRRGVSHVFSNLSEPWSFINNLLQLKFGRALNNVGRFVINTTIGVGGLGDPATKFGYRPTPEDFGQTLARYGAKRSPYLVLPLLGPSTIRDGIGSGVAFFADPVPICIKQCTDLNFVERSAIQVVRVIDVRSQLIDSGADAFLQSSLDPYATARSAYFQRRAIDLADGDADATPGARAPNVDPTMAAPPAVAPTVDGADPFVTPPAAPQTSAPAAPPADPFATPPAEPSVAPARPSAGPDTPGAPPPAVTPPGGTDR